MKQESSQFVSKSVADMFRMHERNRTIDRKHLQKIKKQMLECLVTMPAITVNKPTYVIIDGQHRWKAYMDLINDGELPPDTKLEVKFVNIPVDQEIQAIIRANINSKSWSPADYIHSYIKDGNINYIKLDDWCKTHELTANQKDADKPKYRYGAIMMKGSTLRRELPCGEFTVTDDELKEADAIHKEVVSIIKLLKIPLSGQWIEQMLCSWFKNRKLNTFKEFTNKMKSREGSLRKMNKATVDDWDKLFSQVHTWIDQDKLQVPSAV